MEHIVWSVDPVLLSLGGFKIYWYGALFATAILTGFSVMNKIYKYENKDVAELETLQLYMVIGIVIGARLGHCLFYDPSYYLSNPLKILAVWEGGLASHGGGLGAILATLIYARKFKLDFLYLLDRLAIPTALFAFFVRMGNLMNSEIVGDASDVPWAIVFTKIDALPRHPTQVYEAISYLVIFVLLACIYRYTSKAKQSGFIFGVFLLSVFSARILIEFVKVPQAAYEHISFLSTGQILSIPFLLIGVWLILRSKLPLKN